VKKLNERIRRSKRSGKVVVTGVLVVSLVFSAVLIQGLLLASEAGRQELVVRAFVGLGLLAGLNVFSLVLVRRQHRMLDDTRRELEEIVRGELPEGDS